MFQHIKIITHRFIEVFLTWYVKNNNIQNSKWRPLVTWQINSILYEIMSIYVNDMTYLMGSLAFYWCMAEDLTSTQVLTSMQLMVMLFVNNDIIRSTIEPATLRLPTELYRHTAIF